MSVILIDRRKVGKGKSLNNRQKLVKRVKHFIKDSLPQNIGFGGVQGTNSSGSSPVKIAANSLEEPNFCYAISGFYDEVLPGNTEFQRGDEISSTDGDGDGDDKVVGQGQNGEDEFILNVARNEFLDLFFEDCELPNLTHEKSTDKLENKFHQEGFSTTGTPAQLSIIRSYKQSLSRRWALQSPYKQEIEELEKLIEENKDNEEYVKILKSKIEELKQKCAIFNVFDKIDLRFRKREAKPLKTIDAVLIMIMDISGSMGEHEKTIARRWFALLYAFIKRRYSNTELVFIAHTDEAIEMSEDDFFSTRINGGTTVSPALALAKKIILERYDPNETNIYISHASDGDNWDSDSENVIKELRDGLLPLIQFFSYIETVPVYRSSGLWNLQVTDKSNLFSSYEKIQNKLEQKQKINLSSISSADECYAVFKKVFKKQSQG